MTTSTKDSFSVAVIEYISGKQYLPLLGRYMLIGALSQDYCCKYSKEDDPV